MFYYFSYLHGLMVSSVLNWTGDTEEIDLDGRISSPDPLGFRTPSVSRD